MLARSGVGRDEDLLHFMLECPAYDHIRETYPALFSSNHLPANGRMLHVFNHTDQAGLATCVWHMNLYRAELLGLPRPADAHVHRQPHDYVPANPALRSAADGVGWLHQVHLRTCTIVVALLIVIMLCACYSLFRSILAMRPHYVIT